MAHNNSFRPHKAAGFSPCYTCQREKVPGCGDDGQGAVVVCPAPATVIGAVACAAVGSAGAMAPFAGCGWPAACAGCCDAVRGLRRASALVFGSGSAAAAFFSGSASSAALFCPGAGARESLRGFRRRVSCLFTYSGGIPVRSTPARPGKRSSLRSPGNFFFSLRPNTSSLSGSKSAQPASASRLRKRCKHNDSRTCAHAFSSFHPL